MEAFLISNAIGIISKLLPILQRMQHMNETNEDANQFISRLSRLHLILKEMASQTYSKTTHEILKTLITTLNQSHEYLLEYETKHKIKKLVLNDFYTNKFIKLNDELHKLMQELLICNTVDIKRDTMQIVENGKLDKMMLQMNQMKQTDFKIVLNLVKEHMRISQSEISHLKQMMEKLMTKNETVSEIELQATREIIHEKSKSFDIEYIDDIQIFTDEALGNGSFGTVYLGNWQGILVAIKQLNDYSFKNPNTFKIKSDAFERNRQILREVKAFEKLNKSPYICKFFGITSVNHNLGLVLEYLDNCTLYSWLYFEKQLPMDKIHQIQLGIARGLAYLHSNQIAHNDLKSNNIMLDSLFIPRIIDFGMVKLYSNSNMDSQTTIGNTKSFGTDPWKAPEYWNMYINHMALRESYPFAADIYAFSIILGEIDTKLIPWKGYSSIDIQQAVLKSLRPYSEHNVSSELFQIMKQGWCQHPQDRIKMTQMVDLLDKSQLKENSIKIKSQKSIPILNYAPVDEIIVDHVFGIELFELFKSAIMNINAPLFKSTLFQLLDTILISDISLYIKSLLNLDEQMRQLSSQFTDTLLISMLRYFEIGYSQNLKITFDLFLSCQEDTYAQLMIGWMYQKTLGTRKNNKMAHYYTIIKIAKATKLSP
eukprot:NODE_139_length_16235_cov_0.569038.p2 type:complete len:653 gc:universal NODE_139_length_16235_cov_0.569038:6412-8370(+)